MLDTAERLLRQHGARKVALADVAAACGMSQSNAYRFFASRQHLLDAVGDRLFATIEAELEQIVASAEPPATQFVRFIVRQYELKRDRAVEDPELYRACLDLGIDDIDVVDRHLNRMRMQLDAIMQRCADLGLLGGRDAARAAELADAMTVRYRDPGLIMRFLAVDTPGRAAEVAGIVLAGLRNLPRAA